MTTNEATVETEVDELNLFADECAADDAQADEAEFLPPAKAEFHVTDEGSANWVLGKFLDCDAEEARIKAWYKQALNEVQRKREFFEGRFLPELEAFAQDAIEADGKSKSVKLPNGTFGWRAGKPGLVIRDETAVIGWAEETYPQVLKVTKEISKTALKEIYEATDEVPPGTEVVDPGAKFYYAKPRGMK